MESYHLEKSDHNRFFHVDDLRTPSVETPLREWQTDVDATIKQLLDRGWLDKSSRKWYTAARDGNTVKHSFIDLEISTMWKHAAALAGATAEARMTLYRQVMAAICEETRRAA